ncbi:MAG: hypothetical protein JOZ44_05460 [Acidobacteria bacterium]|nr:hypothetical protein [Acidobacteriota bacterium]
MGTMLKAGCRIALLLLLGSTALGLVPLPARLNASFFGLFGGKQQPPPGWILHKQTVSLSKTDLAAAERPCANWSWVAGITDMAFAAGAHIEQQYLVDRLYGGSVCLPSPGDIGDLAQRISHDYVLEDGQKFRLEAQFSSGAPTQADPLILALRQDRPPMLLWRERVYLLTGMSYDEYIAPTGNKMFMVTELKLFDPAAEEGKHEASFLRERDDPNDLNGWVTVTVYPK